jgi:adenylate cyclase
MEHKQAILVADLSGYTAMTEAHGARSAAHLVKRFVELVNQSLSGNSRLVERIGDEVVIVSDKVDDLVKTALQLQALSQLESDFLAVHAGIHYGDILEEDNQFYGSTINLASRIASHSAGGQVLCSATALANLHDTSEADFKSLGFVRFKNVKEPVEVFEAGYLKDNAEKVFDPVCHMAVAPDRAVGSVHHDGNTFYFCSLTCLNSFSENPVVFVN